MKMIKGISFVLAFCFVATLGQAKEKDKTTVSTEVETVTIFLNGAQVTRTGSKSIDEGVTVLKFDYLSPYINPSSIQVSGQGNFTILGVNHQQNYMNEAKKTKLAEELEDSLSTLNRELSFTQKMYQAYEDERQMVLANKVVNNNSGFDIEDLDDLADYYRNRLANIYKSQLELGKKEQDLNDIISKISNQLSEENGKWNRNTSEIFVEVSTKGKTNAKITLSYFVNQASWRPIYDIRATDINSPVALSYNAMITQNTGEEWENVKLTLATSNPTLGGTQPTPNTWYLRMQEPIMYQQQTRAYSKNADAAAPSAAYGGLDVQAVQEEYMEAATISSYVAVSENQMNTEFKISLPYSIPSDGDEHTVSIQQFDLPATYRYYAAPRYDKDAFLLAKVIGWNKYNLLPGEANIYFAGTFVSKSSINPNTTTDTLNLSLGRDKSIVVTREKIQEFCEKKVVGSTKKETLAYTLTIRNTKSFPVSIDLFDQVPVSTNKDIEIEVLELTGGKHEVEKGFINWNQKVEPNQTKSFILKYSVKYPKDKILNL